MAGRRITNGELARIPFRIRDSASEGVDPPGTLTIQFSKDGGAFATATNSEVTVAAATGNYYVTTTATETNTDGTLTIRVTSTDGTVIPWEEDHEVFDPIAIGDIDSSTQTVFENNHLDHFFAVNYDPDSKPGSPTALMNELVESNGSGVSRLTAIALGLANGGNFLRATTAEIPYILVDDVTHATPTSGVTVAAEVSKDKGAFAAATGTNTDVGNGFYMFSASAADMTGSEIVFRFTGAGVDSRFVPVFTIE